MTELEVKETEEEMMDKTVGEALVSSKNGTTLMMVDEDDMQGWRQMTMNSLSKMRWTITTPSLTRTLVLMNG